MAETELQLLSEMAKWLKFMGRQQAIKVVPEAVSSDDEKRDGALKVTYQLTDGDHATKDIEKFIPYSYKWVSDRHQEWAILGIVEKDGRLDPYEHILSLDDLGIAYPSIPRPEEEED